MMPRVRFSVPWVRGKQRPRTSTRGGHVQVYTPTRTMHDQAEIGVAYKGESLRACSRVETAPKGEPVAVRVDTWRRLPKSTPKRVVSLPDVLGGRDNPDLDNVIKGVLDGLNGVAYEDDRQVTLILAVRHDRTRRDGDLTRVEVAWGDGIAGLVEEFVSEFTRGTEKEQ